MLRLHAAHLRRVHERSARIGLAHPSVGRERVARQSQARSPTDAVALLKDRKLKLIRRSDVFGLYAAEQAIEASGLTRYREYIGRAAATEWSDRTGVCVGSGAGATRVNTTISRC
jgi:3-oxoacyl-(acyl-carrier-protein) synthase